MISYYDGQLTDIMPGNITKYPEVRALSYALQQVCRLLYQYSQRLYIYARLDEQPEEIIDLLASELRTQYYNENLDIETKRSLVRNTLIWYMSAGTPAAVEELVATVFGEGRVMEWYEYGGKPYTFKIKTNAIMMGDEIEYFTKLIKRVKNTRSHLDAIEFSRTTKGTIYAGTAQSCFYIPPVIKEGYNEEREVTQCTIMGSGQNVVIHPAAIR